MQCTYRGQIAIQFYRQKLKLIVSKNVYQALENDTKKLSFYLHELK